MMLIFPVLCGLTENKLLSNEFAYNGRYSSAHTHICAQNKFYLNSKTRGGGGIKPTYLKKCHTSNRIIVAKWVFILK